MDEPTLPPTRRPAAPPTMAQDQAVIGWLATRPALGDLTRDLLLDVLIFWEPLLHLPAVTAVPRSGADGDVGELLGDIDRRLLAHPRHPDDHQTRMVLADLHCLLGLAWYSRLDPRGASDGRRRWEQHLDCVTCLRILETDTAVELALADCAANAASSSPHCHRSARRRPGGQDPDGRSRPAAKALTGRTAPTTAGRDGLRLRNDVTGPAPFCSRR